jgi:hypothetical protein
VLKERTKKFAVGECIEEKMSVVTSISSSGGMEPDQTVIRVYLVNGESRSLRVDERTDVTVSYHMYTAKGGY